MNHELVATYRIQLNKEFNFKDAEEIIPYLKKLGVSHLYSSPILTAKEKSTHGYDVVDHGKLNPELGSYEEFETFIKKLHESNLSLLLDIVPNHIYIGNLENKWWRDVLKNGKKSSYAAFFDIDWHPLKDAFHEKIYLPLLDEPFGNFLENQKIKLVFQDGEFFIQLYTFLIPTDPKTAHLVLDPLLEEFNKVFEPSNPYLQEFKSILHAEQFIEKSDHLFKRCPKMLDILTSHLNTLNGIKGNPASFNDLEKFLKSQHYRLFYWKVANDEINYRRFFDIVEYAAIRMEKEKVFEETHHLILDFIKKGFIQGLRVDHIDGLYEPEKYLHKLKETNISYLIVEKILLGNEVLRKSWPVNGTVGYDFLNSLNQLFIYSDNKSSFLNLYKEFTEINTLPSRVKHDAKRFIILTSLASELNLLTRKLNHITNNHRHSCDFSYENLKKALGEILVYFPVYRSYINASKGEITKEDSRYIVAAIANAKRFDKSIDPAIYTFIQNLFLLERISNDKDYLEKCNDFVMHFQQITSPVMAKGVEDTAFYRYFPLASVNEVGSEMDSFGMSSETFHKKNLDKFEFYPSSLLASTTHDTKRSEDVRARMNALSEIPDQWKQGLWDWNRVNEPLKIQTENYLIPDKNEEYFIYETLIGTWPFEGIDETYIGRIQNYIAKSIKESKIHESWINPDEEYSNNIQLFIKNILNNKDFLNKFTPLKDFIQNMGMLNSLSQVLIKLTSPGIPDIYQGNEIWDFSLVDPDNRRPVDFIKRNKMIDRLENENLQAFLDNPEDGMIKLFITKKTLEFRNKEKELFSLGNYIPLNVQGKTPEHCIAFARLFENRICLIFAAKFFSFFMESFNKYKDENFWNSHFLTIPMEMVGLPFKNIFTNEIHVFSEQKIPLQDLFKVMPFALLTSTT